MNDIRYRRNPMAIWRASGSFLVAAVPPRPPTTVVGSAAMVWSVLDQPRTVDELVSQLAAPTGTGTGTGTGLGTGTGTGLGVGAEALRRDTQALLRELVPTGLVEEVPSCTP